MAFENNRICKLFGIQYPIIQAGMIWCSGWKLASAVSNAGGLGLLGAGSMYPDVLREHIRKCKAATSKPFGVNVPLLYPDINVLMDIIVEEGVKIVFTSAGNPAIWTHWLKERGITVVHVVSSSKFAEKCEKCGVDAIVAEGFEAGGHNGREETTTLVLIPGVRKATSLPLIAAGGIATGSQMLATMALGAEGIQVGTRFVTAIESSAHDNFKEAVINTKEGDTILTLKDITPVRLIKNDFYQQVKEAELRGATKEEMLQILGRARAKKGIFEGDMTEGELEIGQVGALLDKKESSAEIIQAILAGFEESRQRVSEI
jgi:enoyl-[acyl-carrier protein] reductase II